MTAILTYPIERVRQPRAAEVSEMSKAAEAYRRRRLLAFAVVVSLLIGFWSLAQSTQSTSTVEVRSPDAIVVVVQPGDTLWSIASGLAPDSDPRPLVESLKGIAGSNTIQPGQQLVIPSPLLE